MQNTNIYVCMYLYLLIYIYMISCAYTHYVNIHMYIRHKAASSAARNTELLKPQPLNRA